MILHFHKPIECGEHIKFIALDYPIVNKSFTNIANAYEENQLTTEHIVYELIASNDERLLETDYNINPYVGKQKCRYSENTYFYRISFYSQDTEYNDITASLDIQINRIIKCIEKFNTDIIRVQSYNDNSISIISSYDSMYVQHILVLTVLFILQIKNILIALISYHIKKLNISKIILQHMMMKMIG